MGEVMPCFNTPNLNGNFDMVGHHILMPSGNYVVLSIKPWRCRNSWCWPRSLSLFLIKFSECEESDLKFYQRSDVF